MSKLKSKWIIGLNVIHKMIKYLEETQVTIFMTWDRKELVDTIPKAQSIKE